MHGLVTINKLNELAAQNAPGAAEAALAAADASREGKKISQSEINFREATTRARLNREATIDRLAELPLENLLGMIDALEGPSTLEAALSIKLHKILDRGHLQEPDLGAVDPLLASPDLFPPSPEDILPAAHNVWLELYTFIQPDGSFDFGRPRVREEGAPVDPREEFRNVRHLIERSSAASRAVSSRPGAVEEFHGQGHA